MSNRQKLHILCVDDEVIILQSLKQELHTNPFFQDIIIDIADSGIQAMEIINEYITDNTPVPVIVSDQRMPFMNGDTFLSLAHEKLPDTFKILLTGYSDIEAVVKLVNNEILYRYLSKPWDRNDLALTLREACRAWQLKRLIKAQQVRIENLTLAMVSALESANFYFDEETGNHVKRISRISEFIAQRAGLDDQFIKLVKIYAPLHDIGKVGVQKDILLKPAKLTPAEFEQVKNHVKIGYHIINSDEIDTIAKNIVLYHHEKWIGSGYTEGLSGENIPLEARIVAIADVFDALVNERVYKEAFSFEKAIDIMQKERGISFDPNLLDIFMEGVLSLENPVAYFSDNTK